MKKEKTHARCYLRTHRLVWGLSVKELAALVGLQSAPHLSRIEHGKRAPIFEVALACQVLFGIPVSDLFPHVYALVESRVMWNIDQLHSALEKTTSLSGLRKRQICALAMERALKRESESLGV